MDLDSLAQQFAERKFGELVLHHIKLQDLPNTIAALQGTIQELPPSARPVIESWIDEIGANGTDAAFWQRNCGEVFLEICSRARQKLGIHVVGVTDDHVFNMFQIVVLNFAYSAHQHSGSKAFIQKSVGKGFLRRLFS